MFKERGLFEKMNTEKFWEWFRANEGDLFRFENDAEAVLEALSLRLCKVDENISFEISSIDSNGVRKFIFTAGGIRSSFPAVELLVDTAPEIDRWTFVKYRQRSNSLSMVDFGGKNINPDDVSYLMVKDKNPAKVGILFFIDGYNERQRDIFGNIGYLILDEALGEYVVETRVGVFEIFDFSSKYYPESRSVNELGSQFDEIVGTLELIDE